jgi:two-component system cell cycle sensor histidine kinase/response regulator CckA
MRDERERLEGPATERLASIVRRSTDFIGLADSGGKVQFVNDNGRGLIGADPDADLTGLKIEDLVHASSQALVVVDALPCILGNGRWSGEIHLRHLVTGAPILVQAEGFRIDDEAGRPTHIAAVCRDVAESRRAQVALQTSEERLRQAVRVSQIGIYDHEQRTDRLYWSAQQRAFFGLSADEPVSLDVFLELVHPEDHGVIASAVKRAHDPAGDGSFDVEYRILRRDGVVRWLSNRGQTFFEGEGAARRPVRSVGAVVDLTERRRAENEQARLQAQLAHAQKLETVGRLAGGVAHEFNNMLQVILASVELLRRGVPAGEGSRSIANIERAAERARDVTRQLLAFSRKQLTSPAPVNLNTLIADTQEGLARLIGEHIELRFVPDGALWTATIDPAQVDQVLMNLVINARDAMPEGGVLTIETANVELDAAYCRQHAGPRPGQYVRLAVSDNGIGMDTETLSRVFEPFFTTKESGKGTGLGLATVYGIIDQNRGFITAYSEAGHGTTFKAYLPRTVELRAAATPAAEPSVRSAGGTVLLVEDDDLVRRTTAATLEEIGYTVLEASGPTEALAFCDRAELAIDVVLTDVVMPGMSGKELSGRLESLRPGLKVLFMSGYTSNVIAHHGILDSAVHFIPKPFCIGDLARKLREVLASTEESP